MEDALLHHHFESARPSQSCRSRNLCCLVVICIVVGSHQIPCLTKAQSSDQAELAVQVEPLKVSNNGVILAAENSSNASLHDRHDESGNSGISRWLHWIWAGILAIAAKFGDSAMENLCPFFHEKFRSCLFCGFYGGGCGHWLPRFEDTENDLRKNVIMIGNPGAGKSTLLNAIAREAKFRSGVGVGTGVTQKFQSHEVKNIVLSDTPGLNDFKAREQAACEITKALKASGRFKVFYVLKLDDGRIRPEDMTTLQMIVESAGTMICECGVIVNMVPLEVVQKYAKVGESVDKYVKTCVEQAVGRCHFKVFVLLENKYLKSKDDAVRPLPPAMRKFIDEQQEVTITPNRVTAIELDKYESMVQEYQANIDKLNAEFDLKFTQMQQQMQQANSKLVDANTDLVQKLTDAEARRDEERTEMLQKLTDVEVARASETSEMYARLQQAEEAAAQERKTAADERLKFMDVHNKHMAESAARNERVEKTLVKSVEDSRHMMARSAAPASACTVS